MYVSFMFVPSTTAMCIVLIHWW